MLLGDFMLAGTSQSTLIHTWVAQPNTVTVHTILYTAGSAVAPASPHTLV